MLTLLGSNSYGILRDLCSSAVPADKEFDALVEILSAHFSPKRNTILPNVQVQYMSAKL